ncbi:hypothetical protein ACFDTO_32715 [Microbacteriaceae bacterium 4G12]
MKKLIVVGAIVCAILLVYLSTETCNKKNSTSTPNNSLTQSTTSLDIPPIIEDPNYAGDPLGYWTKERMKHAIPADKIEDYTIARHFLCRK